LCHYQLLRSFFKIPSLLKNNYLNDWKQYQNNFNKDKYIQLFKNKFIKNEIDFNSLNWPEIIITPKNSKTLAQATVNITYKINSKKVLKQHSYILQKDQIDKNWYIISRNVLKQNEFFKNQQVKIVENILHAYKNNNWKSYLKNFDIILFMKNAYPKYWQKYQKYQNKNKVIADFKNFITIKKINKYGN
jgi:hypothetical protein